MDFVVKSICLSTHRVTEGQATDYIHAGDYVLSIKNVEPQKKIPSFIQLMARNILGVLLLMRVRA